MNFAIANTLQAKTHLKMMPKGLRWIMQSIFLLVGIVAIVFAAISLATNMELSDILNWISQYFGPSFSLLFIALVVIGVISIYQLRTWQQKRIDTPEFWFQLGIQSANGISTLALTFTLLGISLGIGSLSNQSLSPDNVNQVISSLTAQFSMAFMTTVIGLPTAALIRACMAVSFVKYQSKHTVLDSSEETI